jgi:hypothetical protein
MRTSCTWHLLAAVITLGLGCETIHAEDKRPQFGSDHDALKLTGVWVLQKQFTIGIQNAGTLPFKAFRATLLKVNDFDESEEVLTLEFSSETDYYYNGKESHHILQPGETIFFNKGSIFGELHSETWFSSVCWIRQLVAMTDSQKSVKDQEARVNALLAEGRFILKVTKVVKAEAEDLVVRERPIETPRTPVPTPVPKSKEELAEKNVYEHPLESTTSLRHAEAKDLSVTPEREQSEQTPQREKSPLATEQPSATGTPQTNDAKAPVEVNRATPVPVSPVNPTTSLHNESNVSPTWFAVLSVYSDTPQGRASSQQDRTAFARILASRGENYTIAIYKADNGKLAVTLGNPETETEARDLANHAKQQKLSLTAYPRLGIKWQRIK